MSNEWFIRTKSGPKGPYSMGQLQHFVDRGALRENVAIGIDGQNWRSASTIPGLKFPNSLSHPPSANGGGVSNANEELASLHQALQSAEAEKQKAIRERDEALSQSEESKKQAESILAEARSLKNDAEQATDQAEDQKERNALLQDQLAQQQSQFDGTQQDLSQRQTELESSQRELEQARENLANEHEQLAQEREQLAQEREQLAQEHEQLAKEREELAKEQEALAESGDEFERSREAFDREVAEFESSRKDWEDASQEKEGREKDIEMRLSQLETRDQELIERENQVAKLEGDVQSIRADLAQREQRAVEKQNSLETLENELAVLQRDIDNRTELLESREEELQSKLQAVKESESRIGSSQELQQTLQQRDAELARRETNLLQQISSLRERQEEVANEKQNLLISMARREEELARRERELLEREATFVKRGFQSDQGFMGETGMATPGSYGAPVSGLPIASEPSAAPMPPQTAQPVTHQPIAGQPAPIPTGYSPNSPIVVPGSQMGQMPSTGPVVPVQPGSQAVPQVPLNYSITQQRAQTEQGAMTIAGNNLGGVHLGGADDTVGNGKFVPSPDYAKRASEHRAAEFERRFGPCANVDEARSDDRMSIDVCIHPPYEERDFTTLITSGMSNYPVPMPHGKRSVIAELLLYVTHVDRGSIELLRSAAMIPFIKKNGLAFGSTGSLLDKHSSGIDGSQLDNCVFMLPVIDADSKPVSPVNEGGPTTQPFWLVPITSAERKLIDFSGIHKFLPLLEKNNHPIYFDATRECYVRRKSWFRR